MVRGEIWLANLGTGHGSIQCGIRPVVVISNNMALRHSPVFQVAPLTSRNKNSKLPTHVPIYKNSCGIAIDSTVLCEQSMLVTRNMLINKVGVCDNEALGRINYALRIQFDLVAVC